MIQPDNCPFVVLPPKPFDLLSIERSNCCRSRLLGTEEPLCRSRGAEDEAYRFTWHSSFDGHAMVHIACKRDAIGLRWNYPRLLRRTDDWQTCGGRVLSGTDWGRLRRTLDAAKFWSLDASGNRSGLDGANWLIEGRRNSPSMMQERERRRSSASTICGKRGVRSSPSRL